MPTGRCHRRTFATRCRSGAGSAPKRNRAAPSGTFPRSRRQAQLATPASTLRTCGKRHAPAAEGRVAEHWCAALHVLLEPPRGRPSAKGASSWDRTIRPATVQEPSGTSRHSPRHLLFFWERASQSAMDGCGTGATEPSNRLVGGTRKDCRLGYRLRFTRTTLETSGCSGKRPGAAVATPPCRGRCDQRGRDRTRKMPAGAIAGAKAAPGPAGSVRLRRAGPGRPARCGRLEVSPAPGRPAVGRVSGRRAPAFGTCAGPRSRP